MKKLMTNGHIKRLINMRVPNSTTSAERRKPKDTIKFLTLIIKVLGDFVVYLEELVQRGL